MVPSSLRKTFLDYKTSKRLLKSISIAKDRSLESGGLLPKVQSAEGDFEALLVTGFQQRAAQGKLYDKLIFGGVQAMLQSRSVEEAEIPVTGY